MGSRMLEVLLHQGAKLTISIDQCEVQQFPTYCSIHVVVRRSRHGTGARGRQKDNTDLSFLDFSLCRLFDV